MKTIIIWTTTFVTLAALAFAGVPQTISYQGYLKNPVTGAPVSGTVSMTFSLYSSATPRSNPVWVEPDKQVTVTNGIYSTTVGSAADPIIAPFDVPYYLGINVNGTELPVQPLSSVPYAQRAAVADAVPASAISAGSLTGAMLADGTITAGKLAQGVVTSWQTITSSTAAAVNSGYVTSGATPVEVTLPASAAVGDTISITGAGAGGWTVTANGSQTIISSTSGVLETGAVWSPQPASGARTWTSIASSSDGSKLAAAPYDGQIHTSTDAGVTWTARGLANSWMSIASSTDGVKLVAVAQNNKIYTSDDSGVSWTERNYPGNWRSVTSSADGTKLAAVTFVTAIYTSSDSGATWTNQPATAGLQWLSIASSADGRKLIAGTGGGAGQLYTSSDSGVTWTAQASPIGKEYRAVASSADGVKLVAVAQGGQIYTSGDSGVTWTARESSRQWFAVTSSADGSRLAATLIPGQIYTSSDSGITWTARESSRQWSAVASSADGTRLAAADLNGIIYTSVEGVIDSIIGGPRDNIQLQYVGNNQYQLLSYQPATAATASGIADGSITTAKLADGAVTDAKITGKISGSKISSTGLTAANFTGTLSGDVTGTQGATTVTRIQGRAVYPTPPATDDVLRYDAGFAAWVPIAAITGVTAGAGITGGGVYGNVTLNADFAAAVGDGGVATTVARGDHVHDTRYFTKTELQGNGTINTPSNPVDWSKLTNVPERVVNGPRFAMSETDNTTVIGAACTNYLSVQITVPGPGAIAVEATNRSRISHSYGIEDLPSIHIGSSPTDCADLSGSWMQSIPASLNAVNPIEQTAAPRRAFTVPAAGTYTYYLNGFMANGQDAGDLFWYARMFATYYPN